MFLQCIYKQNNFLTLLTRDSQLESSSERKGYIGGDNSYLEIFLLELSGVVLDTRVCQFVVCFESLVSGFLDVLRALTQRSALLLQNQKSSETV